MLKLDENNQYCFVMTKLIMKGCIKEKTNLTWKALHLLLESVDLDDKIGHLFVVDIEFNCEITTERQIMYIEIYPPTVEKQNILDGTERSVFQLIEQ